MCSFPSRLPLGVNLFNSGDLCVCLLRKSAYVALLSFCSETSLRVVSWYICHHGDYCLLEWTPLCEVLRKSRQTGSVPKVVRV